MNAIRIMVRSIIAGVTVAAALSHASGQAAQLKTPQRIVLVELFTSEGCSSCPPADDLLRKVDEKQTAAGQLIVGISEHVTYWNQLGWRDPFSSSTYTDRQERYVDRFGLDGPYTPQMIVSGQLQFVGSNEAQLAQALADDLNRKRINLQILSTEIHNGKLAIHFAATQLLSSQPLNIVAVLAENHADSKVLRGENSGRSLQHVAVARSMTTVATIHQATDTTVTVAAGAVAGLENEAAFHLILFAQEPGQGAIVGTDAKSVSWTTVR